MKLLLEVGEFVLARKEEAQIKIESDNGASKVHYLARALATLCAAFTRFFGLLLQLAQLTSRASVQCLAPKRER